MDNPNSKILDSFSIDLFISNEILNQKYKLVRFGIFKTVWETLAQGFPTGVREVLQ